jgi:hypothetical protein
MKRGQKRIVKYAGLGCAFILVAGLAAPYLSANRYAEQIRASLEAELGRPVEFSDVRLTLFTGPGFAIQKVVIHDDPAFGREPFAYVESLEARPRLLALIRGRLEFESLLLEDTSVTLTRIESGPRAVWNFAELLRRTKFASLPALYVRSGRVNFKFGDTKSVFYLIDADLDVSPPSISGGSWRVRFSGEPARTDRRARGFGGFTATGKWDQAQSAAGHLDADFRLDNSAMADMISLIYGQDIGVHGLVSARAHLSGPLADLHINGALNVEDVHRWDILPEHGTGWPFEFEGRLDLLAERLEIDSHSAAKAAPPLAIRFRAADYLSRPHWGVGFRWNRFRIEPLLQLARHLGARLPDGLKMGGTLDGAIGYSEQGSWQGQLAFQDAAVTIPQSPPVQFEQAKLLFDGSHVRLPPALARTAGDELVRIEAEYGLSTGALDLTIAADSMEVVALRSQVSLAAVPILDRVRSGTWNGTLRYQGQPDTAGEWSGAFQLENADIPIAGIAGPMRIESASAKLDGPHVALEKIHATIGDLTAQGDYHYEPGAVRPHRVRIAIGALDAAQLENIMMPSLKRNSGLIARAFGFGRVPAPDWLVDRQVDGSIAIESLQLAGLELKKLHARVIWNGTNLVLADLNGTLERGAVKGRLAVDLRGNDPVYRLASRLQSVEWNGGKFDAEAVLDTSGTGQALLENLRSEGSFAGQSFGNEPLDQFESVSGCYVLEWAQPMPHLRFTDLQMSSDGELFLGRGVMQKDGQLLIQVSNGTRQLNVTGTLARLQLGEGASQ